MAKRAFDKLKQEEESNSRSLTDIHSVPLLLKNEWCGVVL